METKLTARGIIKDAYAIMKPKLWTAIGEFAVLFVVYMALTYAFRDLFIIRILVALLYGFAVTVYSLSYVQKGNFAFHDISHVLTLKKFAYFLAASLLVGLAVIGGMILLVVPGIIFAVQMSLYKFIVLEKDMSPMDSIRESIRLTKGHRWMIFRFIILIILISILGFICLIVGSLFTMPLVTIASALVYKKLRDKIPATETVTETAPVDAVTVEAVPA